MGGLDALVFAGGMREDSAEVRRRTVKRIAFLGVALGDEGAEWDADLRARAAPVRTLVTSAREDLEMDRQERGVLTG